MVIQDWEDSTLGMGKVNKGKYDQMTLMPHMQINTIIHTRENQLKVFESFKAFKTDPLTFEFAR